MKFLFAIDASVKNNNEIGVKINYHTSWAARGGLDLDWSLRLVTNVLLLFLESTVELGLEREEFRLLVGGNLAVGC